MNVVGNGRKIESLSVRNDRTGLGASYSPSYNLGNRARQQKLLKALISTVLLALVQKALRIDCLLS